MGNKTSAGSSNKSGIVIKTDQAAAQPKGTMTLHGHNTVQMAQNVLLIWLDDNVDESKSSCRKTITQLQRSMNNINIFTDGEECVQFLEDLQE